MVNKPRLSPFLILRTFLMCGIVGLFMVAGVKGLQREGATIGSALIWGFAAIILYVEIRTWRLRLNGDLTNGENTWP